MNTTELPNLPTRKNCRGKLVMPPNGEVRRYTIIDEVRVIETDNNKKVICLERIKFDDGRTAVRYGYYIIGKKARMLGKWVWGQFAAMMPMNDFKSLIREADEKGWFADCEGVETFLVTN